MRLICFDLGDNLFPWNMNIPSSVSFVLGNSFTPSFVYRHIIRRSVFVTGNVTIDALLLREG